MKKNIFSVLILFSLLVTMVSATNTLPIPALYPSSTTAYDIDKGLSVSCIHSVIADAKGRLWLNPCFSNDIYRNLGFFEFDGAKSTPVSLQSDPSLKQTPIWELGGITPGGLLFGRNFNRTHCFIMDPDSRKNKVFSFGQHEIVTNIMAGKKREVYALLESADAYSLYRLSFAGKSLLTRLKISPKRKNFNYETSGASFQDVIWFLNQDHGFIRYSIADHTIKQYDWNTLKGAPQHGFVGKNPFVSMTVDQRGNPLFYFYAENELFVFDATQETISRHQQVSACLKGLFPVKEIQLNFNHDQAGNILLGFSWLPDAPKDPFFVFFLLDKNGQLFDFNPVAKMAMAGRYGRAASDDMFSSNFKKNVLMATGGGLIAVEVKTELPITGRFKWKGARGISSLDKKRLLVIFESGLRGIVNLETMDTTLLSRDYAPFSDIRALAQLVEKDAYLWFPLENGRLGRYRKKDGAYYEYPIGQTFDKFQFFKNQELILVNERNEVYTYKLDKQQLLPFGKGATPLNVLGNPNEIFLSRSGIIWIASLNGLWRLNPETGDSQRLGKEAGFDDERIMCINEAVDGKLWLGTFGAGVLIYDPKTGKVEIIDQSKGLSNNTVVGILVDEDGDRWVSTFDGLTVLSPLGKVLYGISEKEGISHREFNRYSSYKTFNGQLVFGGVSGINILDPLKIKQAFTKNEELRIYLSSARYYSLAEKKDIRLTTGFDQIKHLKIPATHRYIELDFGLSDYVAPDKTVFSYRIQRNRTPVVGLEEPEIWTTIGSESKLLLNDLPSGDYIILIRAINSKGRWTNAPLSIPIRVKAFFYKTWWFYTICILVLFLGAYYWVQRLIKEREWLENELEVRTRQIRNDKQLIEVQAAKLQEMDELKSRFFTNISHEFRTPLMVISGMVTQIKTDPGNWLEKGMELIQRNSQQLLVLINQILDLRKLESGTLKVHLIHGNIIPYLQYIAESFISMAQSKGLRIHLLSSLTQLEMDYDADKVLHILSNLLSNAIKYTPPPGDIYLQIDRQVIGDQENLVIQVKDTGRGIPAAALPHIFDRFYQADPDHYQGQGQEQPGTGVGLALTQELVLLLGGTIRADSSPGAGSTFTLSLPITRKAPLQHGGSIFSTKNVPTKDPAPLTPKVAVVVPADNRVAVPSVSKKALVASNDAPTLLIVDDNPDVRLYLQACLEPHYQLLMAENGQEGIEMAIELVPDLIVSDVMMPIKNGFELCETLKTDERSSHIPIVLLTARADFESKITGLRKGADSYLAKPFEQEELLVRLEQLLALRKKLQERYRNLSAAPPLTAASEASQSDLGAFQMEDGFIQKFRQLVLERLTEEDFGVVQLCRGLGMGRTQLHNKIKALTGLSTTALLRSIRLNKARELLQTTDLNISEVGYEVGINNPAYFSRIYAEEFGEAPRETRK